VALPKLDSATQACSDFERSEHANSTQNTAHEQAKQRVQCPTSPRTGLSHRCALVPISWTATTTKRPWARKFDTDGKVRQTPAERLADTHTKAAGQRVAKATTVTGLNSRTTLGGAPPSNMISYVMPPDAIDATSSTGPAQSPIQRRSRAPAAWHAAAGLQGATSQRRCRCSWWPQHLVL
jgi:hypothetical protein